MKKMLRFFAFLFGFSLLVISFFVFVQKDNSFLKNIIGGERSWFVSFIEHKLSTPNRQIRLHNIQGILSSEASIDAITISDHKGVWLTITNAKMNWNRLALLRGRIEVNELLVGHVTFLRKPHSSTSVSFLEADHISIPKLPLSISVNAFKAAHVIFGQDFFGLASDISLEGHLALANDAVDADIKAHRLDASGYFSILTKISKKNRTVQIDIIANEPQNGILANVFNIEKRPALNFTIKGDGTFDDLIIALRAEGDRQPILNGNVVLARVLDDHSLSAQLEGTIGLFMPSQYRSLFESNVTLGIEAVITKEGTTRLNHIVVQGEAINAVANAEITADGFLRRLFVDGNIGFDKANESTRLLPLEGQTRVNNLTLTIDYGRQDQQAWKGRLVAHRLSNENIRIRDAIFDMGGVSENLDDPASRHVGIQVNGTLQGVASTKKALEDGLDQAVHIHIDTDIVSGKSILVHDFSIVAQSFSAWLKGEVNRFVFKGDLGLKAQTLAPLGMLIGQPMSGNADIKAKGTMSLLGSAFDLELSGAADNVMIGTKAVDPLLKGKLTISGNVAQNTKGLILHHLRLKNDYANVTANGHLSSVSAEMDVYAQISNLTMLDPRMEGAVTIQGAARGHNSLIMVSTHADITEALFMGKKFQNTMLNVNALVDNTSVSSNVTGFVEGKGIFAQQPLQLSASFENFNRIWKLQDINIEGASTKITGDLFQTFEGFIKGTLHIDVDDISTFAALFSQKGSGKVKGKFVFDEHNGKQKANLKIESDHLIFAKNEIKKLAIQANIFNPVNAVQFEGFVNAERIQTSFMEADRLKFHANGNNKRTVFNVQAVLPNNTNTQFSGRMITAELLTGMKQKIQFDVMDIKYSDFHAKLFTPATIIFDENGVTISELGFIVDQGKIVLNGTFQDVLDLHLTMNAIPVALANLWKPDLGAVGTLSGQVMIHGRFENPDVTYDIKGHELTIAALQERKIKPFMLSANGKMINKTFTLGASLAGEGLQTQTQGTVSLETGELDLHIDLKNLSALLANSFIEGQILRGVVTGKVDIGGTLKDPSAHFEFSSQNLTINSTLHKNASLIDINARGFYEKSILHIQHITATGSKDLDLFVNGRLSLNNSPTELSVKGIMPLVFVDQFLAKRGAHITGIAKIDAVLNGTLSQPQLMGSFSVVNGGFFDSQTNLELSNIMLKSKLNGDHIILEHASARSSGGGSVSVSGRISTDLQTDLSIHLDRINYNDGSMIFATLTGKTTMTGHLLSNLVIGGEVTVEKAEILVSDHFRNATFLDIRHNNLTKLILKTLERADAKAYRSNHNISKEPSSVVQLNMQINAHNQIFVRGRGLDAELGGRISLTGPLHDVQPVGELQMIRGRFDILSRRLNFDKGQASFSGNLNPTVYFVTNSNNGDIHVTVTVSGTIDNLDIQFASQPVLPQDEVLARLIFKRSLNELSPFQIAQLAAAVAELAGASNTSLLNALRAKVGLDDLDVIVDKNGNTGLRVGRYVRDNIYLGFEAGLNGTTKGTIDLDISNHLKAKGAIGNENNSSFGLFYEREY
ncbi:translocation/assembly module TamB domain-containing protein [Bartonella sp. WD12.1]|uniref:translocation/assembly module TamB domain-containing protein n=1 Tax=Bartonella sp. WD12.1 TaxID=1933903 RepID=UPI000999F55F|nr:translocation/assembly module TamB domain-containing protein [Bartonella sp. WD12.1]OPB30413.1 autotransporter secretion inner membrane proteinTamB [Bartonella sp. WD12.1]